MDNNGDTPLHIACSHGNSYLIQKVLNTKMNINLLNNNAETKKKVLITKMNINSLNNNADTPLHVACKLNNETAVQILREKGANLTFVDKSLQTPIIMAAYFNNTEAAKMLFHGSANQKDPFLFIDTDLLMSDIDYISKQNPIDARHGR